MNVSSLVINKQTGEAWENYGPQYLKPIIEFVQQDGSYPDGRYDLGAVTLAEGSSLDDIIV